MEAIDQLSQNAASDELCQLRRVLPVFLHKSADTADKDLVFAASADLAWDCFSKKEKIAALLTSPNFKRHENVLYRRLKPKEAITANCMVSYFGHPNVFSPVEKYCTKTVHDVYGSAAQCWYPICDLDS